MKSRTLLSIATLITVSLMSPNHVLAYLGGFEPVDGYRPFFDDVARYNAGAHGANAGGGFYSSITPNTGLWKKLQGPLFPATGATGNYAYATGHQNFDRTNPSTADQALVITTNADGWGAGPQEYSYDIDSYDLGGFSPASTAGNQVKISFWSCSFIPGIAEGGGLGPNTLANTISFYDSSGNFGFAVGGIQPGTTTDYAAYNVGSWVQSSVAVGTHSYHRWDISLDLAAQTVSIDVFESSVLTNLVSNAPLINTMNDFTQMRFLSAPGINNGKVWALDDFTMMMIPEPGSCLLLVCGSLGLALQRRQRRG